MRIAFIVIGNSRRSNYINGTNLRYGNGGGSGTDTSSILIAEYLAKQGHEVVFVADKLEGPLEEKYQKEGKTYSAGESHYGVQYTNLDFEGIENKIFDVLVSMLWFHQYNLLPITVTKSVIYWSHMQWIYGIDEVINYAKDNNLALGFVHISEWERSMTGILTESIKTREPNLNLHLITIPNPVMNEIIEEVLSTGPIKKPHKFTFHAAWARGGNIAVEAVRQLPYEDKEFHAFDYLMCTHAHADSFFNMHNGVDKKTLFTHLAESEYFIYPLYTPYQDVHKDTFSCVVAEAIALGCIPITYALGALPEYFKDNCMFLTPPEGSNLEQMNTEPLSKDYEGIFTCTDNIVSTIEYLENNPSHKDQLRKGGKDSILNRFSTDIIGSTWTKFLKQLTDDR